MSLHNLPPLSAQRPVVAPITPLGQAGSAPLLPFLPLLAHADPLLAAGAPQASQTLAAVRQDGAGGVLPDQDAAAMRHDQVLMARQISRCAPNSEAMASSWHLMVHTYGKQLASLEQQSARLNLPAALFMAEQNPAVLRQPQAPLGLHPDAWRFVVCGAGGQRQLLCVVAGGPDQSPGRRRRSKIALRIELTLADGSRVTAQIEPLPEGILLDLCASNANALHQIRQLQPAMAAAVENAGLRILRWSFRDTMPIRRIQHQIPPQATAGLTLPVFKAMADLGLLLSAATSHDA